jgi:hypothetical protein
MLCFEYTCLGIVANNGNYIEVAKYFVDQYPNVFAKIIDE